LDKLAALRPAFVKDGSVTAGNSSGINDGAAFLMLMSEEAVQKHHLKPLAEIVGIGQGGVDPQYMGLGPVAAIRDVMKRSGYKLKDMDVIELNEAFAAQSLGVLKSLAEEHDIGFDELLAKTNLQGGAIALGHPVGASGARISVTLLHIMQRHDFKLGLASLCIGGGMGTAVIFKKI
jgi:acetyl-CoA C-acetyltransferase